MSMRKIFTVPVMAGAALAPVVWAAPRPSGRGLSLAEAEQRCRASGLQGWELVDLAADLVAEQFDTHSIWHLWEGPELAMRHRRGWSAQYNAALAELLRRLGFEPRLVHAARVRGLGEAPWWQAGHTWVRLGFGGRTRDVTAARAPEGTGRAQITPTTEVRPVKAWTPWTVTAALAPVSAYQAWKHLASGDPVPSWMWRKLD